MKKLSHGCTLDCFDCCKFNVYVKDNSIVKIEGDKNHPYTKGFICKKGLAHLDRLNHKDRIYNPMIKKDNKWIEISFDEALNIMAEKLKEYKEKFGSKSIMYYEQYGNGSILKSIGNIFLNMYGGASVSKGGPCWSAGIAAQKENFGDVRSHSLDDMLNSKNIFVWGKNPAFTTIHTMQMIRKAKANGSKIIVIDPIYTKTAEISDLYIRVKPGGDLALALAIGKIIIGKNLYDKEYIASYVLGFDDYKRYVESLDLNNLLEISGVSMDELESLVSLYTEKYSTFLLGYGMQKYKSGGNTIKAINTLGAITGQIGFSGGGVNYANKVYPSVINGDPYNSESLGDNRKFYTSDISDFIDYSIKGQTYYEDGIFTKNISNEEDLESLDIPVKMAIITKSNLLNQLPNLNKLKSSMDNIEFKVCFDMFMTDTAKECDMFIPTTSTLESEDLIYSSMTNPYITYNEKALEPKNIYMDEYYFFMELAKRMGIKEYPNVSKREYLTKIIEPLKDYYEDISLDKIKDEYITIHKSVAWEDKKFLTHSGKFEIALYKDSLSYNDEDKIRLLTNHGRDSLSSQHFMDIEGISNAYINKRLALKKGIYDNEVVNLKSEDGSIKVKINIDESVGDNIVMMYVGWWNKHGNPNILTNSGISDIGGQITYNETFVDIEKCI
ncbi:MULTISPECIES: molybdopterin-dependent oxidoreductase [Clostridium]|uniref:Molybdopterin-dependent oxidoreductase n=1 Tax=Clostridium nitritogenes TaxID=83340 RepID=A0ABN1LUW1_9CLOT|nr:molybdopterin-dependent oxidoreductase [Clostridium baratii]MBT9830940.1 molybdopterin-dependent oxidoreductase [Clostridium baratii]STB01063.1 molybdopterin oxidoreductase [Clostridium baratii]